MKTFITTIAAAIILVSNSAFATTTGNTSESKIARSKVAAVNSALDQYTAAVANGQVKKVEKLFTEQFNQRYANNKSQSTFNKDQIVGFLKENKNIQQQCETNYSIVDENNGVAIAKVEMKYEHTTRVDYVTVALNGNSYQISQVVTTWE